MAARRSNTGGDPFAAVRAGTQAHLRRHGCGCYPFFDGSLLGVIAGAARAQRIVELGTALGYTACWFAHGAPQARIDTIDFDPEHVRLARANIEAAGFAQRVVLHEGAFDQILPTLEPGYDIGFFDGFDPTLRNLKDVRALLRPCGILITTNLNFGSEARPYCERLADPKQWLTSFAAEDGRTAISIKV
jgi:predicted O-methyltransferase YrrM